MIGVHEDREGEGYLRPYYQVGCIVTDETGQWGVVTEHSRRYDYFPIVEWLGDDKWGEPKREISRKLSAPYVHTYQGIPDEVLTRATYRKLVSPA